jgi:hypothetical protein
MFKGRLGHMPSARRLIVATGLTVFTVELAIMFGLDVFGLRMPLIMRALLDALILTGIIVPLMIYFLYRPLFRAIDELQHIEEHLVREQGLLRVRDAWRAGQPSEDAAVLGESDRGSATPLVGSGRG